MKKKILDRTKTHLLPGFGRGSDFFCLYSCAITLLYRIKRFQPFVLSKNTVRVLPCLLFCLPQSPWTIFDLGSFATHFLRRNSDICSVQNRPHLLCHGPYTVPIWHPEVYHQIYSMDPQCSGNRPRTLRPLSEYDGSDENTKRESVRFTVGIVGRNSNPFLKEVWLLSGKIFFFWSQPADEQEH